jgi:hypothetical protein
MQRSRIRPLSFSIRRSMNRHVVLAQHRQPARKLLYTSTWRTANLAMGNVRIPIARSAVGHPRISAMGQKRTFLRAQLTSALGPKAVTPPRPVGPIINSGHLQAQPTRPLSASSRHWKQRPIRCCLLRAIRSHISATYSSAVIATMRHRRPLRSCAVLRL